MLEIADTLTLLHPALAIIVVYPLLGMVLRFALQTRQRRLDTQAGGKSKVPPIVGAEHVKTGRWLATSVIGISLVGMGRPILAKMVKAQIWLQPGGSFRLVFAIAMLIVTAGSVTLLLRARPKLWRVVFAVLTSLGLIILGCQPEVYRRGTELWLSHYYFGMIAAHLMILSIAILPEIYQSLTWRRIHIILNAIAVLFFMAQGITGSRDLLEIPLSWQEPVVYSCNFEAKTCPKPPAP
jgi:hypothetical protein